MKKSPQISIEAHSEDPSLRNLRASLHKKAVAKSRTGILLSPNHLSPILRLNGRTATDAVDQLAWEQVLFDLKISSTGKQSPRVAEVAVDAVQARRREGVVPIALLDYDYEEISRKTRARAMRLVLDGQGTQARRLDVDIHPRRAFAASALLEQRFDVFYRLPALHYGLDVTFAIDRDFYFSNRSAAPRRFKVDFGDGEGFREIEWDTPVKVTYDEPGIQTITLEAQGKGGLLRSSFQLEVTPAAPPWNETWTVSGGIGYVFHATSGAAHRHILLVADGFPGHSYEEIWKGMNDGGLWDPLRKLYTIVIMTYDNGRARIQDNSAAVQALIRRAIDKSPNDVSVLGISMGGLIARHAIAKTYQPGAPKRVGTYMSFDTPHRGAIMPIGLQVAVSFFSAKNKEAENSWALMTSPAARQMICFQAPAWNATGTFDLVRPEFLKFFEELRGLGYPPGLKLFAVSNGAIINTGSSFAMALKWVFSACEWADLWLAGPTSTMTSILDIRSDCTRGTVDVTYRYRVKGSDLCDFAPGGLGNGIQRLADGLPSRRDVHFGLSCFIPTVSSLDMSGTWVFDTVPIEQRQTPFQGSYYLDKTRNTPHVSVPPALGQWILSKLKPPTEAKATRRGTTKRREATVRI